MKTTYTVPFELANIHHATATDAGRLALTGIYLDAVHKRIVATDSRMLIYAPVEVDGDISGIISVSDWKRMIADAKRNKFQRLVFALEDGVVTWDGGNGRLIVANYPSLGSVIPSDTHDIDMMVNALDPYLLMQLAKASGWSKKSEGGFQLNQLDPSSPFRITCSWNTEARCLLMPLKRDNESTNAVIARRVLQWASDHLSTVPDGKSCSLESELCNLLSR